METGAGNCWAEILPDGRLRALVSGRDNLNRSRIGEVFFNAKNFDIIEIAEKPILSLGERGVFDHNGTSYPWLVKNVDCEHLYYTGWTIGGHTPFINDLGLAIRKTGSSEFYKYSRAGIFPRTDEEPFGTGSVCVLRTGNNWKMYYTTFTHWGKSGNDHPHYYHIRYATSKNGIDWERSGIISIDYDTSEGEYVVARPCVISYRGLHLMWFSYRGDHYKIGFAISEDGKNWKRHNVLGLDVSPSGWDSEMVSYGFVYENGNYLNMLYSGNGFGRSGLGVAEIEKSELDKVIIKLGYNLI
jgi:predicted GH43/DUF377 family glycosyl hydrolase